MDSRGATDGLRRFTIFNPKNRAKAMEKPDFKVLELIAHNVNKKYVEHMPNHGKVESSFVARKKS
jgi:hypothetical protein